jgi:hypothetical protein
MRLSTFILFNVAFVLIFWAMGYQSMLQSNNPNIGNYTQRMVGINDTSSNQTASVLDPNSIISGIASTIANPTNSTTALGLLAVTTLIVGSVILSYLTGFSANFLIPMLIVIVLLSFNFIFLPYGFIYDATLPEFLRYGIFLIINTFQLIAIIDFIRGGM